jgi:hypothetical protein
MTFHEKLDRLTEVSNRSKLSRAAGLPLNAISDCIKKRYLPRAGNAAKMARALGVSLDWLLDETRGFPPVRVEEPETCHAA